MKKIISKLNILAIILLCLFIISCKQKENPTNEKEEAIIENKTEINTDSKEENETNEPTKTETQSSGKYDHLILGEYSKELDMIDGELGEFIVETIYKYVDSSFLIEKLGQIPVEDLNKPEAIELLVNATESWKDMFEISAIVDYLLDIVIEEETKEVTEISKKYAKKKLSDSNDAVEWAKAITQKYDSIKGNQKLKELAGYMGTDAKQAYQTLTIAQDILKGEYALEEGNAEEWLAILNATKNASKVGVYLCATAITCGATSAVGTAATLSTQQVAGIAVNGVDCLLTIGAEGANIILGEDNKAAKCIATFSDVYSKCNFVYGCFNKPETVGESIAFISDVTEYINGSVSYFFNVDPLGDGGQLVTRVVDSWNKDYDEEAITELKLSGAYQNNETNTTIDEFIENGKDKLVGDELILKLNLENKEEIVSKFNEKYDIKNSIIKTENGISFREASYNGYCYRNSDGYLDGEMVQYAYSKEYGDYIVSRREYSNGVEMSYEQYEPDGLLIYHEYYDIETGMRVKETFYNKNVESNLNPEIRGNKNYFEYAQVSMPSDEDIEKYKQYGCSLVPSGYCKEIFYNRLDDTLIETMRELMNGEIIHSCEYKTSPEGDRYLYHDYKLDEEGNKIQNVFNPDGRESLFQITYPDGQSDGEEYYYGEDEKGTYILTYYYTNGERLPDFTKVYDSETPSENEGSVETEEPIEEIIEEE